jgi:homogentisate 1,2-dioxygenase
MQQHYDNSMVPEGKGNMNDKEGWDRDHHPAPDRDELKYHRGFGNHFESEAIPGALPLGRNNPRLVPHNLYTEQLSGTAFTAPRGENRRTWLYRTKPSACGTSSHFRPCGGDAGNHNANNDDQGQELEGLTLLAKSLPRTFGWADWSRDMRLDPNPMRWGATPLATTDGNGYHGGADNINDGINFIRGTLTLLGSGDPTNKSGMCIYVYAFTADMSPSGAKSQAHSKTATTDLHLYNSDGDFLIVPQQRILSIQTEMGKMEVAPGEICVIPRGIVFAVNITRDDNPGGGMHQEEDDAFARGYILEIFRGHFQLPELGPLGSNGLANARDFLHPVAHHESDEVVAAKPCHIVNKFGQSLFIRTSTHSPYNVVAWHGNYLPFKYDLRLFCAVNSVTYDHPDPSIYTVLTAKGGDEDGTALADFVIFPPRIMATGKWEASEIQS